MVRGDPRRTIRTKYLKVWYGWYGRWLVRQMVAAVNSRERILQLVWRSKDYALMDEKDFERVLAGIETLDELEGMANRRRILNAPSLAKWNDWQRDAIIRRQWELKHGGKRRGRG